MLDGPENPGTGTSDDGTNTDRSTEANRSERRRPEPQVRRIFRGEPPQRFRLHRSHVNPNDAGRAQVHNTGPLNIDGDALDNPLRNARMNGNGNRYNNGNIATNGNRNFQRMRWGGRGLIAMRQLQQQRPNGSNPPARQHQRQQQQQQQQQQHQQQQYHPMGLNGPIQLGPNGPVPVQIRMVQVQVEPLTPQPLLTSVATNATAVGGSLGTSERAQDPAQYERFKCQICYEYMNDPVGCGKCSSRFCRACLQRVFDSDRQNEQLTRCPVCRCEYDRVVPDRELYGSAAKDDIPRLPCRYVSIGCEERSVPLSEIAKHEQLCEHAPVRCRYASCGCTWTGKRRLVRAHEEYGCKLAPMGPFIEQFRQTKVDHTMRLEMIAQQASAAVRMSHVLRQTYTRDNQRKSLSDVLRLFQYCHAVTSLTPHFFMTKDLWVSYWRNHETRAAVVNFCVCIPFLSATIGVVGHGTNSFFDLFQDVSPGRTLVMLARALEGANMNIANVTSPEAIATIIKKLQKSHTEELLENTFLGLCVGSLGMLVIMLNYVDTKSSISWDKISLPLFGGRFPLVGDVLAVSIFTLLLAIMEYHQSNMRAWVLWTALVPTSTFFPALIFSISHNTARLVTGTPSPAAFNMIKTARLVEPCMFGLRFSMLMTYFGVMPTLDASVAISLVPQTSRMYLKNSLLDHTPQGAFLFWLAAKSSFWVFKIKMLLFDGNLDWRALKSAVTIESAQKFFTSSPDAIALSRVFDDIAASFMATASLLITCFVINNFFTLGITVGEYISHTSKRELSPEGIARGTAKEYSSVGIFAFGSWAMINAFLVYI
eukprot:CAMPEP_0172364922 /NCGR_PEP_ID=MMETSP1060-20121228/7943_1 /TAXON_ID=37318 /ORGANISM="Pseudo-nitzschia pungens, Strain cf. cingulata" /LENGTH=820 /DNA_ID=CAMNT_0013088051 /DNA_START=61 /DNA_END=2523 /DNA_ORIENTATION=+